MVDSLDRLHIRKLLGGAGYINLGVVAALRSRYLQALARRPAFVTVWKEVAKLSLPLKVQCLMRRSLRRPGRECSHVS
jgi:hypothetical protein